MGGSGIGTKFLYKETNEKTDPLSPENCLIFMDGLLTNLGFLELEGMKLFLNNLLLEFFSQSNIKGKIYF